MPSLHHKIDSGHIDFLIIAPEKSFCENLAQKTAISIYALVNQLKILILVLSLYCNSLVMLHFSSWAVLWNMVYNWNDCTDIEGQETHMDSKVALAT